MLPAGLVHEDCEAKMRLLSIAAAAHVLGCNPRTLAVRCSDGTLPAVRLGRVWRIRRSTVAGIVAGEIQVGARAA